MEALSDQIINGGNRWHDKCLAVFYTHHVEELRKHLPTANIKPWEEKSVRQILKDMEFTNDNFTNLEEIRKEVDFIYFQCFFGSKSLIQPSHV